MHKHGVSERVQYAEHVFGASDDVPDNFCLGPHNEQAYYGPDGDPTYPRRLLFCCLSAALGSPGADRADQRTGCKVGQAGQEDGAASAASGRLAAVEHLRKQGVADGTRFNDFHCDASGAPWQRDEFSAGVGVGLGVANHEWRPEASPRGSSRTSFV